MKTKKSLETTTKNCLSIAVEDEDEAMLWVLVYLTWYCYNRLLVKAATLSPALGGCSGAGHGGHSWDAGLWPLHWPQWWLGPGAGQTMTGGAPVPNNCHTTTTTNNLTVASSRQRANSLRNHLNNYYFSQFSVINESNVKVRMKSKHRPSVCDSLYRSIETILESTRCPKKKWELLVLLQVVTPTFFGTPCIFSPTKIIGKWRNIFQSVPGASISIL